VRPIQRIAVRERKADFMVYELLGLANTSDPELAVNVTATSTQAHVAS
jgi:hypothetical protein